VSRVVVWLSCGAASAVAAKLACNEYGDRCEVVYCDTMATEHHDNQRFFEDVENWIGKSITKIHSKLYEDVDDVFETTRYMAGIQGARCTLEMKKIPRFDYQLPDDIHIFGFTADETRRIDSFEKRNPELHTDHILLRNGLTKEDCFLYLRKAGIALPMMYELGYLNNNCLGCVKATSARYWNMIRRDFPEIFEKRAKLSRELGVKLTRFHRTTRVYLDELPEDYMPAEPLENISCGPDCQGSLFEPEILNDE